MILTIKPIPADSASAGYAGVARYLSPIRAEIEDDGKPCVKSLVLGSVPGIVADSLFAEQRLFDLDAFMRRNSPQKTRGFVEPLPEFNAYEAY